MAAHDRSGPAARSRPVITPLDGSRRAVVDAVRAAERAGQPVAAAAFAAMSRDARARSLRAQRR